MCIISFESNSAFYALFSFPSALCCYLVSLYAPFSVKYDSRTRKNIMHCFDESSGYLTTIYRYSFHRWLDRNQSLLRLALYIHSRAPPPIILWSTEVACSSVHFYSLSCPHYPILCIHAIGSSCFPHVYTEMLYSCCYCCWRFIDANGSYKCNCSPRCWLQMYCIINT